MKLKKIKSGVYEITIDDKTYLIKKYRHTNSSYENWYVIIKKHDSDYDRNCKYYAIVQSFQKKYAIEALKHYLKNNQK